MTEKSSKSSWPARKPAQESPSSQEGEPASVVRRATDDEDPQHFLDVPWPERVPEGRTSCADLKGDEPRCVEPAPKHPNAKELSANLIIRQGRRGGSQGATRQRVCRIASRFARRPASPLGSGLLAMVVVGLSGYRSLRRPEAGWAVPGFSAGRLAVGRGAGLATGAAPRASSPPPKSSRRSTRTSSK